MNHPIDFQEGSSVKITEETLEIIKNSNRSILAYPSSSYIDKISKYVGQVGKVQRRFRPGYEFNLEFPDGKAFHCKENWVEFVPTYENSIGLTFDNVDGCVVSSFQLLTKNPEGKISAVAVIDCRDEVVVWEANSKKIDFYGYDYITFRAWAINQQRKLIETRNNR